MEGCLVWFLFCLFVCSLALVNSFCCHVTGNIRPYGLCLTPTPVSLTGDSEAAEGPRPQ